MKKIYSIILVIFCIFSFNTCFKVEAAVTVPETQQEVLPELPMDGQVDDDVLKEPVFNAEKKKPEKNEVASIIKTVILWGLTGAALLALIIFCVSFVPAANVQRKNEAQRKKLGANANVIDAVDNFARHRIK